MVEGGQVVGLPEKKVDDRVMHPVEHDTVGDAGRAARVYDDVVAISGQRLRGS